jgi:hypothetical protein
MFPELTITELACYAFSAESGVLDRLEEIKELEQENIIHSWTLTANLESVECVAIVLLPSIGFTLARALLQSGQSRQESYLTLRMAFERPSGDPDLDNFAVDYSEQLEAELGCHATVKWAVPNFQDIRTFVGLVKRTAMHQIYEVMQQWTRRAAFILDIYSAYENMVRVLSAEILSALI